MVEHKHRWEKQKQNTTVGEYIKNIDATEYYWRQFGISDLGLEIPAFPALHRRTDTVWFDHAWVGPSGTVGTFHQDNHDDVIINCNAFMQMHGIKYAAIASPRDSKLFEAESLSPGYGGVSMASPFDPELRRAAATLSHVVLLPGDLLFIPERWWHYLQSVTPSVSVSRWWFENRIAETLYMAANSPAASSDDNLDSTDWQHDLAEFGGRDVLVEFLSRFTIQQKHIMMFALVRRYGPLAGISFYSASRLVCVQLDTRVSYQPEAPAREWSLGMHERTLRAGIAPSLGLCGVCAIQA